MGDLPDPAEIAALLTAARLPAGPADIAAAVRAYPDLRAACDALFDVADGDGPQLW